MSYKHIWFCVCFYFVSMDLCYLMSSLTKSDVTKNIYQLFYLIIALKYRSTFLVWISTGLRLLITQVVYILISRTTAKPCSSLIFFLILSQSPVLNWKLRYDLLVTYYDVLIDSSCVFYNAKSKKFLDLTVVKTIFRLYTVKIGATMIFIMTFNFSKDSCVEYFYVIDSPVSNFYS